MKLFVSYAHSNSESALTLIRCLSRVHTVWYDQHIQCAKPWWDAIIEQIMSCDVFVIALTPEWLLSLFCQAEWDYARALGKVIVPVNMGGVAPESTPISLRRIQWNKWSDQDGAACEKLVEALQEIEPVPVLQPLPNPPSMPIEPYERLEQRINDLPLDFDEQQLLFEEIKTYWNEKTLATQARRLFQKLHSHPNLLALVRDQIEGITPALGYPKLMNRLRSNLYEAYGDFIKKAEHTIHNYGTGLNSVGPHIQLFKGAVEQGVRLHFMHIDTRLVSDATAHFFGHARKETVLTELKATSLHLAHLFEFAKSCWPEDFYLRCMVRWRETGPDLGILARDIDHDSGVMRVEFFTHNTSSDQWLGLLLYPSQPLFEFYRQFIKALWRESLQTVAAIIPDSSADPKILMTRRAIAPFEGMWSIPGGHIDPGETAFDAVIREVYEETGLTIRPAFLGQFEEDFPSHNHLARVNVFVSDQFNGTIQRQADEVAEIQWMTLGQALGEKLAFGHSNILAAYAKKLG